LRASGELFFLLTMTYMDVGKSYGWIVKATSVRKRRSG
jgi:hypothetical protein